MADSLGTLAASRKIDLPLLEFLIEQGHIRYMGEDRLNSDDVGWYAEFFDSSPTTLSNAQLRTRNELYERFLYWKYHNA